MKNLIVKDLRLATHPITIIYYILAGGMMFIPNYPRFIGFFYILIAVFITFQTDLQYKDREFCGILPVSKKETVISRTIVVSMLEIGVILISIPCAIISKLVLGSTFPENDAGMNTNLTVFASVLVAYGISNIIMIPGAYRKSFQIKMRFFIAMFVFIAVCGIMEFAVSDIDGLEYLSSDSAANLARQIPALLIGIVLYVALTFFACQRAIKEYERAEV